MRLRKILTTALCCGALTMMAVPARPGGQYTLSQSDGTTVTLRLYGDEHNHYYLTDDDQIVVGAEGAYRYATIDTDGNYVVSDVLAHNPAERTAAEATFVGTLQPRAISEAMTARTQRVAMSRSNTQDGVGKIPTNFPSIGSIKTLAILVSFSDLDFVTPDPHDYFSRLLNEEGFSDNEGKGSCRDYYLTASRGLFDGEFDVYGPVKLPNEVSYYGGNTSNGQDKGLNRMVLDACKGLKDEIDYSQYDVDGDGYVDNVFFFFAGLGENNGGGANAIWPQQSSIGRNMSYRFNGVYVSRFACASELQSSGRSDGIGTFCHEFGHVLGLPDLYNTSNMSTTYDPQEFSLMSRGSYNDHSTCPPTLSAYERNALGWMGDDLIEITGPASCTLQPLLDEGKAYLINTDSPREFFILENRQQNGWDKKLPAHGMLVWHIDYDVQIFTRNQANNDKDHQRVDLVEAGGTISSSSLTKMSYPFPGSKKVTSYTYDGKPSFRSWSGYDMGLPITDIAEKGGVITFNVAGGGSDPASVTDIRHDGGVISYAINGLNVTARSTGALTLVDLAGRTVATGNGTIEARVSAPGVYILCGEGESHKLMLR